MAYDQSRTEQARLAALDCCDILDTPHEEAFDRVTRLTRRIFRAPASVVSLIDGHRQWFKACSGFDVDQTPRSSAMCDVTIRQRTPLIIPDALADPRFREHPMVVDYGQRFYAGVPLVVDGDHAVGSLCAFDTVPHAVEAEDIQALQDLGSIVEAELALRRAATSDGLTGALTRRAFLEEGERLLALAGRHGHDLACIVLDVDHFKRINDGHGHAAGDAVLGAVVQACHAILRKSDLIGRIGGEEFAVLLPHTGRADATAVAEKLRSAVAQERIDVGGTTLRVSASFGIASFDRSVEALGALMQRADSALYEAKEDGRNRCIAWAPKPGAVQPAMPRRVLKAGLISFNGGHSTMDCTVRSLSPEGASVDVVNSGGVPDRFKLRIETDNFSRGCQVMHKRETRLEVSFV